MNTESFSALSWNCEGLKNNIFLLQQILLSTKYDFIALSESQLFQCDARQVLQYLDGEYCYFLNSDDLHDPELPSINNRSFGGTLMLWNKQLDPHIEVYKTSSPAFLPVILKKPGLRTSIHVALYLPTHGKDPQFVSELANLRNCLDELVERHHDPIIYIRGDSNVNPKNATRVTLLKQFLADYMLDATDISHATYHHFVGNGLYDSKIDVLLHSSGSNLVDEFVTEIMCRQSNPAILSHHDIILSRFSIPTAKQEIFTGKLINAPRIDHTRVKVQWTPEGKSEYSELVGPLLAQARKDWLDPASQTCMSVLLKITNDILNMAARRTNKTTTEMKHTPKPKQTPKPIKKALNKVSKAHKKFKSGGHRNATEADAKQAFSSAKKNYRRAVRTFNLEAGIKRDEELFSICGDKPSKVYNYLKRQRNAKISKIEKLTVGSKVYTGSAVCDGFYESMTSLKQCSVDELRADPSLSDQFLNYEHIMKLCQDHHQIPAISIQDSTSLLSRMKKNVRDYYSITTLHYLNAGTEGQIHFNYLLNAIISDVNNATIEELNIALGIILYKGHGKEKTSDRAYRTISTCPFLAKSLDLYLRDLYVHLWNDCQAETQYQGSGSSHELASLLITEVIQHSLYVAKKPVFLLALDAQSAFDRCLRQILCSELYRAQVPKAAIKYIDNRLASRKTVYEWDGVKMGPARDITGFEQGGINSSDFYKLYNNEQITAAQTSKLGVDVGSSVISAVAQADDVLLVANDLFDLRLLVKLTENYCAKYRVKLEPGKTKLIAYCTNDNQILVKYAEATNLITINNVQVKFSSEAEHVGVIRNKEGNLPNIISRIAKHKKVLGSVLSAGSARSHRGNPAASLRVHMLYCTPILLSGLATLVLTKPEIRILEHHYQTTLLRLQRLHDKTPRAIVYFLAGSIPAEALLHLRQLSLFSMICHLPGDPLNIHARYVLTLSAPSAQSWFQQVRDNCRQYQLPHPLDLLDSPLPRKYFKKLAKLRVTEYWQHLFAEECVSRTSLRYFDPHKCSLLSPHPVWTSAGSNSYECNKSTILARMISGRYRTEMLCSHWSSNKLGFCEAETCVETEGDLEHLLVTCPALKPDRDRIHKLWLDKAARIPALKCLIPQPSIK